MYFKVAYHDMGRYFYYVKLIQFLNNGIRGQFILYYDIDKVFNGSRPTGLWLFKDLQYCNLVLNKQIIQKLDGVFNVQNISSTS